MTDLNLPTVSVCIPTQDRRHLIPALIHCMRHQDYPHALIEWVVVDDGQDQVEDMFATFDNLVYLPLYNRMSIGAKRNLMNEISTGQIIVAMDDDDYYPPTRISHAVKMFQESPWATVAGCRLCRLYVSRLDSIYIAGPYSFNYTHAHAMAYRREALVDNRFDDSDFRTEELAFLANTPIVDLNPSLSVLHIVHGTNTIEKERLLSIHYEAGLVKESPLKLKDVVDQQIAHFYSQHDSSCSSVGEEHRNLHDRLIAAESVVSAGTNHIGHTEETRLLKKRLSQMERLLAYRNPGLPRRKSQHDLTHYAEPPLSQ